MIEVSEFESRYSQELSLLQVVQTTLRPTQPPIQLVLGAPSPEVKRSRHEANHSSPTSAEVKEKSIDTSTPTCAFMA
jgi:hypothetical protein